MNSNNDFIPIIDILSDVAQMVGDPDFSRGLSKGFYVRQISEAIEELALDTYFQVLTHDAEFPADTLIMSLPANCFNIREIHLYDGVCGKPTTSRPVWFKRRYNNSQGGEEYTAKRKETGLSDPFMPTNGGEDNLYYANIQNGNIMFGSLCKNHAFVRLVYNGMGAEITEVPLIPRPLRQAVIDWTRERILTIFAARDRSVLSLLNLARLDLQGDGTPRNPGSWKKAERYVKKMGTWAKESYAEYNTRGNW